MLGLGVLKMIYEYFSDDPYRFEAFAADIWLMSDERVASVDVTRPTRDGGRDAIGEYLLGPESDPIRIDFALEAKCYGLGNGVGVREVSRLISRLRARQFGILVTTSYLADQAYQEIRSDGHPIVVISGRDIVEILSRVGLRTVTEVDEYLRVNHPRETAGAFDADARQLPPLVVDLNRPVVDVEAGLLAEDDFEPTPSVTSADTYAPRPGWS
jgi:hypothetical protein